MFPKLNPDKKGCLTPHSTVNFARGKNDFRVSFSHYRLRVSIYIVWFLCFYLPDSRRRGTLFGDWSHWWEILAFITDLYDCNHFRSLLSFFLLFLIRKKMELQKKTVENKKKTKEEDDEVLFPSNVMLKEIEFQKFLFDSKSCRLIFQWLSLVAPVLLFWVKNTSPCLERFSLFW